MIQPPPLPSPPARTTKNGLFVWLHREPFPALTMLGSVLTGLAITAAILGLVGGIVGAVMALAQGAGAFAVAPLVAGPLCGLVVAFVLKATAENIEVFLAIERNTRNEGQR